MKQKSPDRWVKPFFKQYRTALAVALCLGVATFGFASGLMFTSGFLIAAAAEMPGSILMIHLPTVFVRIFGVGKPVLQYLERLTSHDWVLRMTSGLRSKLYASIEGDAINFRRTRRTGDVLGLLAEDIGHLQNLYLRTVFPLVVAWLLSIVIVVVLGFFSWWFALAMALSLFVITVVLPLVSTLVNRARISRAKAMKNELYRELTDNVLGVSDWLFARRGDEYLNRHHASEQALRAINTKLDRFARWRDLLATVLFGGLAILTLVWAAGQYGGVHGASANWIAAIVLGFFPLIDAFAPLSTAAAESGAYRDSIERLNEMPEERPAAAAPATQDPLTLHIQDVRYRYPASTRMVLDGITLTIEPGERIAILGRSGSGKSTLASLMRGDLTPSAGSVTLGGQATNLFGDDMACYLGVIQQQTYLFNRPLIENLRIGNEAASVEEVWEVLERVGLRSMVEQLPEGLNTLVDEAGMRFSGGERHRIALARVLLQDTPLILLDEPTVGLDPATERALLKTILETTKGKTLILITHHLQGVADMDRVVFVEDGRLALTGTPSDLERTSERYRTLLAFDRGLAPCPSKALA
ncbi:thiol reductant ABC exporter subunit CydC [Eggerthella sp. YY7918]|uniref:thiol reductant ABC exporter subunit CydC n=1 Tax=Eggerthella sp. (strain YY7918) TaxID=502558 RepID=UPI000217194D|nr:thiol reductant ABC exporter subunit CydC [Eggerthella sp. YY7918]BAK45165.1 ABC-type multidrug/protein/lipid transport system, ATPase component [Eggerthella sp. YY7918]